MGNPAVPDRREKEKEKEKENEKERQYPATDPSHSIHRKKEMETEM